uniref:Uncharacterized protein n=1 Tax=Caenorhabditis tropicalis TaxID=1561998 RepID=A0A1I7V368_9PELO
MSSPNSLLNRRKTEPKKLLNTKNGSLTTSYGYGEVSNGRNRACSMYSVSSDILRVSGYTQQFRSLLTARFSPRRESTPNVSIEDGEERSKNDHLSFEMNYY